MLSNQLSPIAINHYICPKNINFTDFLDLAKSYGYSAVGICVRTLDELSVKEINQELKARDMGVSSINSAGLFIEDGVISNRQMHNNYRLLKAATYLQQGVLNIIPGNAGVSQSIEQSRLIALDKTREFVTLADQSGVQTVLEPFFPTGVLIKNCVNTIKQALDWHNEIPSMKLNIDLFHTWWDPDLWKLNSGKYPLGLFQVCGISNSSLPNTYLRSNLNKLNFELTEFIRKFRSFYPKIYTEVELFADQISEDEAILVIKQSEHLLNKED